MSSKGWRPEKWELPVWITDKSCKQEAYEAIMVFEEGADAMLEALRKTGTHYEAGIHPPYRGVHPVAGTEVFIPDDSPHLRVSIKSDSAGFSPEDRRQAGPLPYKIAGCFYNTPVKISNAIVEERGHWCNCCGAKLLDTMGMYVYYDTHNCRTEKRGISYQEAWVDDGSSHWQTR